MTFFVHENYFDFNFEITSLICMRIQSQFRE